MVTETVFFCCGHLEMRPEDGSREFTFGGRKRRFCQECAEFLSGDMGQAADPVTPQPEIPPEPPESPTSCNKSTTPTPTTPADLLTLKTPTIVTGTKAFRDTVHELHAQGLSTRAISARLLESGCSVSHMTVSRILKGTSLGKD